MGTESYNYSLVCIILSHNRASYTFPKIWNDKGKSCKISGFLYLKLFFQDMSSYADGDQIMSFVLN